MSEPDNRITQVLEDAATILESDGWCQGLYHQGSRSCAIGALMRAAGTEDDDALAVQVPFMLMQEAIGMNDVAFWNDQPNRTAAQVIAKLREAAQLYRDTPPSTATDEEIPL